MRSGARRAGISVPLFSLRSTRSWGIGEIGDIPAFASWLRIAAQSVLQILPLNELAPGESSPYSALSAMAIDPQFISIWLVEDVEIAEWETDAEVDAVRRSPRIHYARLRRLKYRALRSAFDRFLNTQWLAGTPRASAFRGYIAREHWWLDEYSLFRALRAEEGDRPWIEWTPEERDPTPAVRERARERLAREILFFQYLQWTAAEQLDGVRRQLEGLQILGDFPFMVTLDSADVWSRRDDFMLNASVGTPPDAFSATGQEWGLPPYDWSRAQRNDFEWLRLRARRSAELYDGFRVDHLVGFYRTYVRPLNGQPPYFMPGGEPEQRALGEALMRVFIETGADISVEDLGTVPDFVRQSIAAIGLPGYKVLRWEPTDPVFYPPRSVAMTGTHDTEPLATWWDALPAHDRRRFGVDIPFDVRVRDHLLQRIYDAGSELVLLPIQDVFGWRDRINHPATISDRNWTYTLPWPVDRLDREPEAQDAATRLNAWAERSARGPVSKP
jgi:4-alpha-glucanotransferase